MARSLTAVFSRDQEARARSPQRSQQQKNKAYIEALMVAAELKKNAVAKGLDRAVIAKLLEEFHRKYSAFNNYKVMYARLGRIR